MQRWDLLDIDAPAGTRDPVVLHTDDHARAVMIRIAPGQELGPHQVKERAWVTVLEGAVSVGADGKATDAGPGTLFRFERDERHSVSSAEGARILMFLAPWPGEGHYRGEEKSL